MKTSKCIEPLISGINRYSIPKNANFIGIENDEYYAYLIYSYKEKNERVLEQRKIYMWYVDEEVNGKYKYKKIGNVNYLVGFKCEVYE